MHRSTPLLRSDPLSERFGPDVWLKLENLQPSGSFKLRGLGLASERAVSRGARRLVIASGGNAGLAVAWAGRELRVPVTVVVPVTTGAPRRDLLRALGAEVEVEGAAWDEAHLRAVPAPQCRRPADLDVAIVRVRPDDQNSKCRIRHAETRVFG